MDNDEKIPERSISYEFRSRIIPKNSVFLAEIVVLADGMKIAINKEFPFHFLKPEAIGVIIEELRAELETLRAARIRQERAAGN